MIEEYIEREAILDLLKNKYQDMSAMPASYYKGFQYALKTIEKIKPAADVVPVVRCKDCVYYDFEHGCPLRESGYFSNGNPLPHENDFCSYGEMRDNND